MRADLIGYLVKGPEHIKLTTGLASFMGVR